EGDMPMSARSRGFALVLMVSALVAGSASAATAHKRSHTGASAQPALIPTPDCPPLPTSEAAPWADPKFGPDCQAQFVIDDLENPASPRYAQSSGAPAQSTLQRLVAALATGDNIQPASGANTNLLALYGLTVNGSTDDGANGERSNGL